VGPAKKASLGEQFVPFRWLVLPAAGNASRWAPKPMKKYSCVKRKCDGLQNQIIRRSKSETLNSVQVVRRSKSISRLRISGKRVEKRINASKTQ
jgi:hypothetical protein